MFKYCIADGDASDSSCLLISCVATGVSGLDDPWLCQAGCHGYRWEPRAMLLHGCVDRHLVLELLLHLCQVEHDAVTVRLVCQARSTCAHVLKGVDECVRICAPGRACQHGPQGTIPSKGG